MQPQSDSTPTVSNAWHGGCKDLNNELHIHVLNGDNTYIAEFYEGNSMIPEVGVYHFESSSWKDVTAHALPNGQTNGFRLEDSPTQGRYVLTRLGSRQRFQFHVDRFVPAN